MPIEEIDVEELERRRDHGWFLLDVRNPDEFAEARVPGARLVPLPELEDRRAELPADAPIAVICRSGARSARAVELLGVHGIGAVNVAGGTLAWIESGRPVDSGPSRT